MKDKRRLIGALQTATIFLGAGALGCDSGGNPTEATWVCFFITIGVIVYAMSGGKLTSGGYEKTCRYCRKSISTAASVCPYCTKDQ